MSKKTEDIERAYSAQYPLWDPMTDPGDSRMDLTQILFRLYGFILFSRFIFVLPLQTIFK
jgi:hypothetical protein